ncbi:IclR family transcriptional regulator [Propionibacterium australiense]|uniref:GAF domain-like n=1 Tax=Propionibacterium australiense TaxID=119981 RepID=A0A383S2W7_9ACTN|nr:IclR family transcriptional regulator [Propionibacterium australiense]RLP06456.1 IclR family transcriptional regulator [Propionibacterium australiense]RLP11599.1 IclR family transcriptional regulator [Propionibacterium australiense]SYZ32320.1 GAF domain-like [Propionibacterium australiense]VEH90446.1 Transcriptional regulator kdgR [Propionibacterium australiense]
MASATNGPARIEAIDRALVLLEDLSRAGAGGFSLAEICSRVGMNKSTAYRALTTMRGRDYVQQDPESGNYALGPAALMLSSRYFTDDALAQGMHPGIVALSREIDELVHLGVMKGDTIVYLDKVEPSRTIRVWSDIGRTVPAWSTALGRAILAFTGVERQQLAAYLPVGDSAREDHLWLMLEFARDHGYSFENEENEPGIACLGVPLLRGDHPVAALSVTTFASTFTPDRRAELVSAIAAVVPPLLPGGIALPELRA